MTLRSRYDHVVVGAGTAGCAVAAILSEDGSRTVLLIEAGTDRGEDDPTGSANLFEALAVPGRTWPDVLARRVPGGALRAYPRGRGVGGSGAVNGLVATAGRPADYNRWATDFGCEAWSWQAVSPVFARLRRDLRTQPRDQWQGADRALWMASAAGGHDVVEPVDAWTRVGVGPALLSLGEPDGSGTARRRSADDQFLREARDRPNLTLLTDSPVEELLIVGRRICGVRVTTVEVATRRADTPDGGATHEIAAGHVTVCAGAIHSPLLLQRSGIDREGIGRNLRDHPAVRFTLALRHAATPGSPATSCVLHTEDGLQVVPVSGLGVSAQERRLGAFMVGAMRSHATGTVVASGVAGAGGARIQLDVLSDDRDRAALRAAAKLLVSLCGWPGIASEVESVAIDDRGTAPDALGSATDGDLDSWVRDNLADYVHGAGTCRMGDPTDPLAVVDPRCSLIGYQGLSVIDASVFPDLPEANPNLATLMVAVRAARWLAEA